MGIREEKNLSKSEMRALFIDKLKNSNSTKTSTPIKTVDNTGTLNISKLIQKNKEKKDAILEIIDTNLNIQKQFNNQLNNREYITTNLIKNNIKNMQITKNNTQELINLHDNKIKSIYNILKEPLKKILTSPETIIMITTVGVTTAFFLIPAIKQLNAISSIQTENQIEN